jgi:hypothetical protein
MLKSLNPPPVPFYPGDLDLKAQACAARAELYPVTLFYAPWIALALGHALWSQETRLPGGLFFALGILLWTLVEYLVHRYVLHPPFPDGREPMRHALHALFDNLHWEHHERPWDGKHLSGSVSQTLPVFVVLSLLSLLTPLHAGPVLLAGLALGYITEEWVHYSIHFERLRGSYPGWTRRNHLRHHASPSAEGLGFGITTGLWDFVWGTRFPSAKRSRGEAGEGPDPQADRQGP